ncbi:hypothetical protein [Halobacillus amylolyticus]|uniref:Uncharacterized protein n=1 Tax=Halobacillus amylolyticus TaxID=2932259 RepID=A0ABY4HKN9_9BACI|nr:hypothetical protein [Halobacillus amylolyticus]UOR14090.1 hypothetical protein MUO15_21275 [Halobacillus amylolyticus]
MDPDMENILMKYITLPLVLKVFNRDQKLFDDFKTRNVYLDKLDAVMESVQTDLNHVRQQMYLKHHIDVKPLKPKGEIHPYKWKTLDHEGIIELSSNELQELTKNAMQEYLYGSLSKPHKQTNRSWYE